MPREDMDVWSGALYRRDVQVPRERKDARSGLSNEALISREYRDARSDPRRMEDMPRVGGSVCNTELYQRFSQELAGNGNRPAFL
jgi:hypothetical protein